MPCEFSKVVCSSYDTMLKQCSVLAIICFINCHLISCSWMSIYIPKMDVTCVLTAKIVDYDKDSYIRRVYCSMESCVAACLSHSTSCNLIKYSPFTKVCDLYFANATRHIVYPSDKIGQSMHFQLQSCHKNISTLPAGMVVQKNYHAERIQLIAASSLKRCIAFCEAPTYTSCNSVLFSAQEGTCLLLFRSIRTQLFNGIAPTIQSSALFVAILACNDDFDPPFGNAIPNFRLIVPTAYSISNIKVSLYRVHFYATTAAIRLRLWDTANEFECLMICLDKFLADYCDGFYFSYEEKTCLTFRIREEYALPNSQHDRHIIRFAVDQMTIRIPRDLRLHSLMYSNHLTVEMKVPLHEFKEVCTVEHSILTAIPRIKFIQQYVNISFLNDCISKCRFIRSSGLCEGIAYSKEKKACLIAVNGNNDDEVLLNGGYHFLTLHNCSKDREVERAHNDPPELHAFPLLDEICLVEFYKPLVLNCQEFILNTLQRYVWKYGQDFVELNLIPYGNARRTKLNNTWTIQCQHGPVECALNKLHGCAISKLVYVEKWFPLIVCLEEAAKLKMDPDTAFLLCSKKKKLNQTLSIAIYKCAYSIEGDLIQLQMAEITENVKPHPHYFVPWILINDVSTAQLQTFQNGLFNFLCDWHRGSVPKGCADYSNLLKQRKNLQLSSQFIKIKNIEKI
ncbi:GILT-like protein [Trichinella pseudospiralis]